MTTLTRTTRSRRPRLRGAFTALVTPFTRDGTLDEPAFRRLVAWQILAGIDGLVPCGTTGEAPTLTIAERERLIELTVEIAERPCATDRRIAGTGTNDMTTTQRPCARDLRRRGAVRRRYNRPDGRMLEAHLLYRRRGRPSDRRVQRPSRMGTNVDADIPPAGRLSAGRGQGSVGQPAYRASSRPPARRGRAGRRRCLDIADPRPRRRWRRVRREQRDPRRDGRAMRGRAGRGLGCGAARARTLAAADAGELPRRAEPGPGQGRAPPDGPDRVRSDPPAAAAARGRPARGAQPVAPIARARRPPAGQS